MLNHLLKELRGYNNFLHERGIDLFKISFSVPGIARKMLFKAAQKESAIFPLMAKTNEDLYLTYKKNLVGGPAIVFCRHQKVDETPVRDKGEDLCKSIVGYDANALYLWSISQEMPTGIFIRRVEEKNFRPEKHCHYFIATIWLEWMVGWMFLIGGKHYF